MMLMMLFFLFFYLKVYYNNINKIKSGIPAKYWGIQHDIPIPPVLFYRLLKLVFNP